MKQKLFDKLPKLCYKFHYYFNLKLYDGKEWTCQLLNCKEFKIEFCLAIIRKWKFLFRIILVTYKMLMLLHYMALTCY